MESSHHPASWLREALLANNNTITLGPDDTFTLNGRKFSKDTPTCLKRSVGNQVIYYTLNDIVYFLRNVDNKDYRKNAMTDRVNAIISTDQLPVKEYFTRKSDSCILIDQLVLQRQIKEYSSSSAASAATSSSATSAAKTAPEASNKRGHADMTKDPAASDATTEGSAPFSNERKRLNALLGIPAQDRNSVLRNPGSDYSSVIKSFSESVLKHPNYEPQSSGAGPEAKASASKSGAAELPIAAGPPIIIVPSAITSAITMLNAVDFLQNGVYYSSNEKRSAGQVGEKEKSFYRKTSNGSVKYKVIDSPQLLKKEDWARVVAVFVFGEAWQFKSWALSNPTELFQKVLGIHLQIDGQVVPPLISSWNCKVLKVHPTHRHQDAIAYNQFWSYMDDFLKYNKSHLFTSAK
jgi:hypothetical protein